MSTVRIISFIFLSLCYSQTKYVTQIAYDGWGLFANRVPVDSITNNAYRLEMYYPDQKVGFIQFFSRKGNYKKGQEYLYDQEGLLNRIIYYDQSHHVKWAYHFDYDPIIKDWRVEKRSSRGEYLDEMYLQEMQYDTTNIDEGFFLGLPSQIQLY